MIFSYYLDYFLIFLSSLGLNNTEATAVVVFMKFSDISFLCLMQCKNTIIIH